MANKYEDLGAIAAEKPDYSELGAIPAYDPSLVKSQRDRGTWENVKFFLGESIVKPVVRTTQSFPAGLESIWQIGIRNLKDTAIKQLKEDNAWEKSLIIPTEMEFPDRTPEQLARIDRNNEILEHLTKAEEVSERIQQQWIDISEGGFTERDPKVWQGTYMENPSAVRTIAMGFESVPILGLAAATTAVTKSPMAGASIIGLLEAAPMHKTMLDEGFSMAEANGMFAINTTVLSVLESIPLTGFLKGGKFLTRVGRGVLQEGTEEVAQGLWMNAVEKFGWNDSKSLYDGLVEGFIAGGLSGGVIGGVSPSNIQKIDKIIAKAKAAGIDVDALIETIPSIVEGSADAIQDNINGKVIDSMAEPEKVQPEPTEAVKEGISEPLAEEAKKDADKRLKEMGINEDLRKIIIDEGIDVFTVEDKKWDDEMFPAVLAEGMFVEGVKWKDGKIRKPAFHMRKNLRKCNINELIAHELGHHLDKKLGLAQKIAKKGDAFINKVFRAGFQNLVKKDLSGEALDKWRKAFEDGDVHFAGEAVAEIVRRWKNEPGFAEKNSEIAQFLEEEINIPEGNKAQGGESLEQQAKKFKSAEEFVASQSGNVKDIASQYKQEGVDSFVSESEQSITLSKVVVPKDQRGSGVGSKFMNDLVAYSDSTGKTIKLTPSKDFGASSVSRLKDFYKKFGFVENKGQNKDLSISESMYRIPKESESKSQLTDIFNKAQEIKDKEKPIKTLAKDSLASDIIEQIEDLKDSNATNSEVLGYLKETEKEIKNEKASLKGIVSKVAEEYGVDSFYTSKDGANMVDLAKSLQLKNADELIAYLKAVNDKVATVEREIDLWNERKKKDKIVTKMSALKEQLRVAKKGLVTGAKQATENIKSFQNQLRKEIKALGLTANDRDKLKILIENANNEKKFNEAIDEINRRATQYLEAGMKRTVGKHIAKELKTTKAVKKGQKTVGKYDYESNKLFDDLRNINKMTQASAQAELDKMPTEGLSYEDLVKARLLSYKANGASGSLDLHKQVLADIINLKHLGSLAKNEQEFMKSVERKEDVTEMLQEIKQTKGNKKTIMAKILDVYRKGFTSFHSNVSGMAGVKMAEKLDPEHLQQDKEIAINKKINTVTIQVAKILGLKDKTRVYGAIQKLETDMYEATDFQGLKTEISKLQIIDIYNSIKNDLGKERYYNYLGEEQVVRLIDNLTPEEKELADYMMETIEEYDEPSNQRHIEITGRDRGRVQNYWPFSSEHTADFYDDYKMQGETPSARKARSVSSKIIPVPRNAWLKMEKHIAEAEHEKHLSRAYENLKRLFTNRMVKNHIENKFGDEAYKLLLTQIENISLNKASTDIDYILTTFGKALNNWRMAKIALSPSVFAKQLNSVINYAEKMPVGSWAKGFFKGLRHPKATFDYMWEGSEGFLEARFNKGYSETIKEAIRGADSIVKNKSGWAKGLSAFGRTGDITAIVYGGYSYVKHLEKSMSKKDAFEKFKADTLKAQQSGLSAGMSQLQNSRHPLTKLFTSFKNTVSQYARKQVDAILSYQRGDITAGQLAKVTTIYSVINPLMYVTTGELVIQGWKILGSILFGTDQPEDDPEEFGKELAVKLITNPLAAIPVINGLSEAIAREAFGLKTYDAISAPLLSDLNTAYRKSTKKEITLEDYLSIFGTVGEVTTGAPVQKVLRIKKYLLGDPNSKAKTKTYF